MLKKALWGIIFIVMIAGLTEFVLRYKYGFLQAPLYISDPDFEYIYAPNQNLVRFGNRIKTNRFSMRSEEINPSDTTVILLIGDSVVTGGNLTDQDSLASTLLEKRLSKTFNRTVRVLNISAGSWGPDNAAAYLKKYGLFNADLMCLVTSSHDAHDIMNHADVVGIDTNMPSKQYEWAIQELWVRYIYPRYIHNSSVFDISYAPVDPAQSDGIHKEGIGFNPGYRQLKEIAKANGIPFFIYLHPELSEIAAKSYNSEGQEIINYALQDTVRLIRELDLGVNPSLYRSNDPIHFNHNGQLFLTNQLYPIILEYLSPQLR